MNVRLFKPSLGESELAAVSAAFDSGWIGLGPRVSEFEKAWSGHLGIGSSMAVNSATAALHLALMAYEFPKGKKVMVPVITFASTAFAAIYNGLEPVFVDVDKDTISMSITDLERKYDQDCVAIIPVHFAGHPAKMNEIISFAEARGMKVIEDCAHTSGSYFKNKKLGTWGDISCFSFEEKKILTTGDGGMLCSDDTELIESIRPSRWVGIDKDTWRRSGGYTMSGDSNPNHWYYEISRLGYKYNMNDLAASIGLAQLKKLNAMNERRSDIVGLYLAGLKNISHLKPLLPYDPDQYVYHIFGIRSQSRDDLILHLKSNGIATGVHYVPLIHFHYFKKWKTSCPTAEEIWKSFITLPLHADLSDSEIQYVLETLDTF